MKKKILYIDDEEINLKLFNIHFNKDFDVYTSSIPEKSIEIVREKDIRVVITDYKMPKMNGQELIQKLKAEVPECICMILSAYQQKDIDIDKTTIFKYLTKPYQRRYLQRSIEEAFAYLEQQN